MDKSTGVRILFTGQHWPGANSLYIARAFERCGAIVRLVNETNIVPGWESYSGRVARRLLRKVIVAEWNRQLLRDALLIHPDLVYITNADYCLPETLAVLKKNSLPTMCFYHDVYWDKRPGSNFSINLPGFDLIATTRQWQKPEFLSAGAKDVLVVRFGYEPDAHRPVEVPPAARQYYGSEITFIGTCEPHRAHQIDELVKTDFDYDFKIWGMQWDRNAGDSKLIKYWQNRAVYESEIPIVYSSSKVALHWLGWEPDGANKALQKGDQHNSRTFQIAACGGALMVAQRTPEHCNFFRENEEAVYFDDIPELREKLSYWLNPQRESQRITIAKNARRRCQVDDYSYKPVVKAFLDYFNLPSI